MLKGISILLILLLFSSYSYSSPRQAYKKTRDKWAVTEKLYDQLIVGGHRTLGEEDKVKTGTFYGVEATLTFLAKEVIENYWKYQVSELNLSEEEAEDLKKSYYQGYSLGDSLCFILEISNQSQKGFISLKNFRDNIVLVDNSEKEYKPVKYDPIFDEEFTGDISGKVYFPKVITKDTKWIKILLNNIYSEKEANIYHRENFFEFSYKIPKDISSVIYSPSDEKEIEKIRTEEEKKEDKNNELEEILKEGINFYKKGEIERAIKNFQKILKIDKDNIIACNMLGLAYLEKGLVDAAIYTFDKAIQIDPFLSLSQYNQGLAYYKKKDIERAIISFSQAIAINEKYADAHYYLALCYEESKEYEKSLKEYEEVLKLQPENKEAKEAILKIKNREE